MNAISAFVNANFNGFTKKQSDEFLRFNPRLFPLLFGGHNYEVGAKVVYTYGKEDRVCRGILHGKKGDRVSIRYFRDKTIAIPPEKVFKVLQPPQIPSPSPSPSPPPLHIPSPSPTHTPSPSDEEEDHESESESEEDMRGMGAREIKHLLRSRGGDTPHALLKAVLPVVRKLSGFGYNTMSLLGEVTFETWHEMLVEEWPNRKAICGTWASSIRKRLSDQILPPSTKRHGGEYRGLTRRNPQFTGDFKLADTYKFLMIFRALLKFNKSGRAWGNLNHKREFAGLLTKLAPYFTVDLSGNTRGGWLANCRKHFAKARVFQGGFYRGTDIPRNAGGGVDKKRLMRHLKHLAHDCRRRLEYADDGGESE